MIWPYTLTHLTWCGNSDTLLLAMLASDCPIPPSATLVAHVDPPPTPVGQDSGTSIVLQPDLVTPIVIHPATLSQAENEVLAEIAADLNQPWHEKATCGCYQCFELRVWEQIFSNEGGVWFGNLPTQSPRESKVLRGITD